MRRVLIELPTWIGDTVMATPAIENIVKNLNDYEIIFIGSKNSIDILRHHPKHPKLYLFNKKFSKLILRAKEIGQIDIFVSFRSSIRSKFFSLILRAKHKHQYNKNKFSIGHQVEKYNTFAQGVIGINFKTSKLKLYQPKGKMYSKKPLLGINPGASYGSAKCWPIKKFIETILILSDKFDVLILGGENEIDLSKEIERDLIRKGCRNFKNLSGKTSIEELVSIVSGLDLFITGDSGPMHIAAAFQIPTVSIFGPTKEYETCQWMNPKSIIVKKELVCQPCMKRVCPLKHHNCMEKIASKEIIESALSLI